MDFSQKVATAIAVFLAVVMICGGLGFISYTYGYRVGQDTSHGQEYSQGKNEAYQSGYKSGIEVGAQPVTSAATSGGFTLRNPTYQEMKAFLAQDTTNLNQYREEDYVCVDFAAAVTNNAVPKGIRCATVDMFYPDGYGHTIVAFQTTDKGLVFIEPQFDQEVKLIVGKIYAATNAFTPAPRDDTIRRFVIVW